jgi:hypothetical protein
MARFGNEEGRMEQKQATLQALVAGIAGGAIGAVALHLLTADPRGPLPSVQYIGTGNGGVVRVELRSGDLARCFPDPDGSVYLLCGNDYANAVLFRREEQQRQQAQ